MTPFCFHDAPIGEDPFQLQLEIGPFERPVKIIEDGVAVVPLAKAADVLKKSQELDDTEHRMLPFIEKFRSINEAVKQFGRI